MIRKLFHSHPDIVIAVLAVVFLVAIVACYAWAIGDMYMEIHQALVSPVTQTTPTFDLAAAAKLDLRGIASGTTPGASVSVPVVAAPPATAPSPSTASSGITASSAPVPGLGTLPSGFLR